jgi:eukaryotic-like serine/threonine-protein kinase
MTLSTRVWGAGKLLLLGVGLVATFLLFAVAAARIAVRSQEVTVPDLSGRSVNEASSILTELGLTLRVDENRRIHPKVPADHVMSQEPAAGIRARRQRSVKVWLSVGSQAPNVPALEGQTTRTAEMRLRQDGLQLDTMAEIRSAEYPADSVVAQEPPPASRGTKVALLVNRGERGATYVLRSRGFRVALVGTQPYPGVPAGIIIRQAPAGGFQIAPGEAIALEVSR